MRYLTDPFRYLADPFGISPGRCSILAISSSLRGARPKAASGVLTAYCFQGFLKHVRASRSLLRQVPPEGPRYCKFIVFGLFGGGEKVLLKGLKGTLGTFGSLRT